ncbi:DNA repair exonuclease [Rubrivivax sp. JA1024]|nr:DNA repair exonuclease [Rubrivivax sp. JA1024]
MTTLIHTADWQIGRQYGGFEPEDAAALADARFAAVERIARLAADEQADAVLVAGDVFDAQGVSARTIRRMFNAMAPFSGPWVLIPGNHDAALAEGVWRHALRLNVVPANVKLALEPGVVELPEARAAVLCAPLTQRHTYTDLTEAFDGWATPEGWLRLGLAHGAVQGLLAEDIDSANPVAPDRAERARLDYLALGDWHGAKRIGERCWYAGTPEQDRFKDNGAGQVLRVRIAGPGAVPEVEPLPLGRHRWRTLERRLAVPSDVEALVAELAACGADEVLQLTLTGTLDLAGRARLDEAIAAAEARVRALRCERGGLRLAPTAEDLAALHADGYLGEVLAELREADGPVEQEALALLAGLLAGREEAAA